MRYIIFVTFLLFSYLSSANESKIISQPVPAENLKTEETPQVSSATKEQKNPPSVSESFAPTNQEAIKGEGVLTSALENYSWIWDSKKTTQEIAFVPIYFMSNAYGANWGLRWFTFSPNNQGYYLSIDFKNQIGSRFIDIGGEFIKKRSGGLETEASANYTNYLEPYFFGEGMKTTDKEQAFVYYKRVFLHYQMVKREKTGVFYGVEGDFIFRAESRATLSDTRQKRIPTEIIFSGKILLGHDSRDNWQNTTTGHYHTFSFGCVPSLGYGSSFCSVDLDLRTYFYVQKNLRLALRGFGGTTLLAPSTYSLAYRLGGVEVLRGFSDNRFRGDKIYFLQAELRRNLWKDRVSGVGFLELGEVASFDKKFEKPRWDYGVGLRFGIPPSYDIKARLDVGFSTDKNDEQMMNFIINFLQAF